MRRNPHQIERASHPNMLQMGFRQTLVATAPPSHRAYRLRNRPFDARPQSRALPKFLRLLLFATLDESLLRRLRRQREAASLLVVGAERLHRTPLTVPRVKLDHQDLLVPSVLGRFTAHGVLPLRTGRHLGLPVQLKVLWRIARLRAPLPTGRLGYRSDDLGPVFPLGRERLAAGVALIHQVLTRRQTALTRPLADGHQ